MKKHKNVHKNGPVGGGLMVDIGTQASRDISSQTYTVESSNIGHQKPVSFKWNLFLIFISIFRWI